MPFHKPVPGSKPRDPFSSGAKTGLQSMVQVEKIAQIAFILPTAVVIGWLGGAWLDQHLHQSWITLTGIILGSIAGMTSAIKLALAMSNDPPKNAGTGTSSQPKDPDALQ